jgi:hypothetical protein
MATNGLGLFDSHLRRLGPSGRQRIAGALTGRPCRSRPFARQPRLRGGKAAGVRIVIQLARDDESGRISDDSADAFLAAPGSIDSRSVDKVCWAVEDCGDGGLSASLIHLARPRAFRGSYDVEGTLQRQSLDGAGRNATTSDRSDVFASRRP